MKKVLIAALALAGTACGGKHSSSTPSLSCNVPAPYSICILASGPSTALTSGGYTPAACTGLTGTTVAACAGGRIGHCTLPPDNQPTGVVAVVVSYYAPWDTTTAPTDCATTWTGTFAAG
jgi:hypothetical protein